MSVFSTNTGNDGPEKTLYLETFHAVGDSCEWSVFFGIINIDWWKLETTKVAICFNIFDGVSSILYVWDC